MDLTAFFKPTLVVLDAIRILTANGPQGGSLKYVKRLNTVAAGGDPVAIDAVGATLFGLIPEEMEHLHIATQRGLGRMDVGKLRIKEVAANS